MSRSRAVSIPFITGMEMSSTRTSGFRSCAASRACWPSVTVPTTLHSFFNSLATRSSIASWSSAKSTRIRSNSRLPPTPGYGPLRQEKDKTYEQPKILRPKICLRKPAKPCNFLTTRKRRGWVLEELTVFGGNFVSSATFWKRYTRELRIGSNPHCS